MTKKNNLENKLNVKLDEIDKLKKEFEYSSTDLVFI